MHTTLRSEGEQRRCSWCARMMPAREPGVVGRPAQYCRRSCRQRAYESRRRSQELGVTDDELVITRNELDDLGDRLAEVSFALTEAARDVADGIDPSTVLVRLLDQIESTIGTN